MNIKPGFFTITAATLKSQMYISACFDRAEISYKIESKAKKSIGDRAFDISAAHVSCFKVKNKHKKKAVEALNALPEAQKQFLLKNEQGFESIIS